MRELTEAALRDGIPPNCPGAVWAFIARAASEGMAGDWHAAIRVITDAEATLRAAGDAPVGLSFLYSAAANFHNLLGDFEAAAVDAELSLEAARRSQNPTATASAQFAPRLPSAATIRRPRPLHSTRASPSDGSGRAADCSGSRWPAVRCCGPRPATSPARVEIRAKR